MHPKLEASLAAQAPPQCLQIKDVSMKHVRRIAALLKVPLYLAARYLVDSSAKHPCLISLCVSWSIQASVPDALEDSLAEESPRCPALQFDGHSSSLLCLAGSLSGCSREGSPVQSQRVFSCLPFAFWMQFIFYSWLGGEQIHFIKELSASLNWILSSLTYKQWHKHDNVQHRFLSNTVLSSGCWNSI